MINGFVSAHTRVCHHSGSLVIIRSIVFLWIEDQWMHHGYVDCIRGCRFMECQWYSLSTSGFYSNYTDGHDITVKWLYIPYFNVSLKLLIKMWFIMSSIVTFQRSHANYLYIWRYLYRCMYIITFIFTTTVRILYFLHWQIHYNY